MKRKNLTIIGIIAAAIVLTIAATAMAAPGFPFEAAVPAAAEIPADDIVCLEGIEGENATVTTAAYEINGETGEISVNGEIIGTYNPDDPEQGITLAPTDGGEPVVVSLSPAGDDGMSFSIVESAENEGGRTATFTWTATEE